MKIVAIIGLLVFSFYLKAQNTDTVVCNKNYMILKRYENGRAKELGQSIDSIKNGAWIYLDKTGKIVRAGSFINNIKEGNWWNGTSRFIIYKKGRQMAVGYGCWCCPDF